MYRPTSRRSRLSSAFSASNSARGMLTIYASTTRDCCQSWRLCRRQLLTGSLLVCHEPSDTTLRAAARFTQLTDPQLVHEHGEVGVELVVADTFGKHDQGARVVDRHPGSLVGDLLIAVRPERLGGVGTAGLE